MISNLFFAGFSILVLISLLLTAHFHKKAGYKSILGLFGFGVLISVPFILIEHFGIHFSYWLIIVAFLLIELGILFFEHHIRYLHELIHRNIKELRIASFILIGLGFTYSEIGFTILHTSDTVELLNTIPFKATYALLMHTVFASAASVIRIGDFVASLFHLSILKSVTYYIKIGIISVSHFLYVFSVAQNLMLLIGLLLIVGVISFLYIKTKLELKPEAIA
jgi:hypothetical protein